MKRLVNWWKVNFLFAEFWLSVVVAVAFTLWATVGGGSAHIDTLLKGSKGTVYATLASIFGSLLGFTITAVSIVLSFSANEKLGLVRNSAHYPTIWRTFIASIRALGVATLASLVGLVLDRDNSPIHLVLYVAVWATTWAVLRLARTVWVFENVISIVTMPSKERPGNVA
jgi:hypothetical protein